MKFMLARGGSDIDLDFEVVDAMASDLGHHYEWFLERLAKEALSANKR
jgi:hypothetical protein